MKLTVTLDNTQFPFWKSFRLNRSIESLAGCFSFEVYVPAGVVCRVGAQCIVHIDDTLVLTGWLEEKTERVTSAGHTLSFSGRCRCGDLIDCALQSMSFRDVTAQWIIEEVTKPFNIKFLGSLKKKVRQFSVELGESPYEVIERIAKGSGVMIASGPTGDLNIIGIASAPLQSIDASSVLDIEMSSSWRERYSRVVVHATASGDDAKWGKSLRSRAWAEDTSITRQRELHIGLDGVDAQRRATWEVSMRRARGESLKVSCVNWGSPLYWPGNTYQINLPQLQMFEKLVLKDLTLHADGSGMRSELTLCEMHALEADL